MVDESLFLMTRRRVEWWSDVHWLHVCVYDIDRRAVTPRSLLPSGHGRPFAGVTPASAAAVRRRRPTSAGVRRRDGGGGGGGGGRDSDVVVGWSAAQHAGAPLVRHAKLSRRHAVKCRRHRCQLARRRAASPRPSCRSSSRCLATHPPAINVSLFPLPFPACICRGPLNSQSIALPPSPPPSAAAVVQLSSAFMNMHRHHHRAVSAAALSAIFMYIFVTGRN